MSAAVATSCPLDSAGSDEAIARIYLDYNASTPMDPRVLAVMLPYFTELAANPASPHGTGRSAAAAVETAAARYLSSVSVRHPG